MPVTLPPDPQVRLHLHPDSLASALQPLRLWGDWPDPAAWRSGATAPLTGTPRSWVLANGPRFGHQGMTPDEAQLLLHGLRLVLAAGYDRYNHPDDHADTPALWDRVRSQAADCTRRTQAVISWLHADVQALAPTYADATAVYALARALVPFLDPAAWERQLSLDDDPDDPDAGTWVCRAGISAKLHAEAVFARWTPGLDADPYMDPIPGTDPDAWVQVGVDHAAPPCTCNPLDGGCGWSGTYAQLEHHLRESLCPRCRTVVRHRDTAGLVAPAVQREGVLHLRLVTTDDLPDNLDRMGHGDLLDRADPPTTPRR